MQVQHPPYIGTVPNSDHRILTPGERDLARSVFGTTIDYDAVRIHRRKWLPFQPKNVAMAPMGDIHFHPAGDLWCEDFAIASLVRQGFFLHEMTHVWQAQLRGRWWLPLMRHPFCRYRYSLVPGRPFDHYGIEQQAEIVRHAWATRQGLMPRGAFPAACYDGLLPFGRL